MLRRAFHSSTLTAAVSGASVGCTVTRSMSSYRDGDGQYEGMGLANFRAKPIAGVKLVSSMQRHQEKRQPTDDPIRESSTQEATKFGKAASFGDVNVRVEEIIRKAKLAAAPAREREYKRENTYEHRRSRYNREGEGDTMRGRDTKGVEVPFHYRKHTAESLSSRPVDPKTGVPVADNKLNYRARQRRTQLADASAEDSTDLSRKAQLPVSAWSGTVSIFDCFENSVSAEDVYAAGGSFATMEELAKRVLPRACGDKLLESLKKQNWSEPTALQQAAIPVLLQGRDACIVGPTGTGKTAAYLIPLLARCAAKLDGTVATGAALSTAARQGIEQGTICKHCELDIASNVVCPMTGKFHQKPNGNASDKFGDGDDRMDYHSAATLNESSRRTEPLAVVIVPTALLVQQLYTVARSLAPASVRVGFLYRATSEEEGRRMIMAYEGCNVLITTPEQMANALLKRKVSLRSVKTVAFDEMTKLLETQVFEALKMTLGALPKGADRPQRAFIGSAFPKAIREPMRTAFLHKNQRIIVASGDSVMNTAGVGHIGGAHKKPLRVSNQNSALDIAADPLGSVAATNANTLHTVFMLSRLEKLDKLKALYDSLRLTADQRTIVFCNSHSAATFIVRSLRDVLMRQYNLNMMICHNKMTPAGQRTAVAALNSGASTCLVCTDMISMGLDIKNVTHVVNFDMPPVFETWVNRVGRCGRMGQKGHTYTFFTPENVRVAAPLVKYLKKASADGEFGRQVIPPKLLEYASQNFTELFASKNFFDMNRSNSKSREEHFTDVAGLSERYAHFGRDGDVTRFRRPET